MLIYLSWNSFEVNDSLTNLSLIFSVTRHTFEEFMPNMISYTYDFIRYIYIYIYIYK